MWGAMGKGQWSVIGGWGLVGMGDGSSWDIPTTWLTLYTDNMVDTFLKR